MLQPTPYSISPNRYRVILILALIVSISALFGFMYFFPLAFDLIPWLRYLFYFAIVVILLLAQRGWKMINYWESVIRESNKMMSTFKRSKK